MSVRDIIQAAAGQGEDKLYVDDVFSTYLYTGNGSTQTITNGIDLAGEGGLVWTKNRTLGTPHVFIDTNRGVRYGLFSNSATGNVDYGDPSAGISSFTSTGYSISTNASFNNSGNTYASWTFRKAPKFFDVVTYTGTGANRTVAHNLGAVPGMIIVKRTDTTGDWRVYHRANTAAPETDYLVLNTTASTADSNTRWNDTLPTDSVFSLGTEATVNASGGSYVAYLFAHDAGGFGETGDDSIVACGSYVGNGAAGNTITLGWEPQWVLIKKTNEAEDWNMVDMMRGMPVNDVQQQLRPNNSGAESAAGVFANPTATGFEVGSNVNDNADTYIYLAIRRPNKPPESGTEVFKSIAYTGDGSTRSYNVGFPTDFSLNQSRNVFGDSPTWNDRLRGSGRELYSNDTVSEAVIGTNGTQFDNSTNIIVQSYRITNGSLYVNHSFRRAPGFFDVVCYTGTGSGYPFPPHNLGVTPELAIFKKRNATQAWYVYHKDFLPLVSDGLVLNTNAAVAYVAGWNANFFSSTVLGVTGQLNDASATYVAYLFASLDGISKVGSYTGTGTTQQINCGFTTGARFVLIKRTDSTGDWYVWDTARGIVSGNDPYLLLNSSAAEVTSTDYIDPLASGFEISSTAPAAINASGGSFIFLAIA